MATTPVGRLESLCANCQKSGDLACRACLLVTYCGKDCQTAHWKTHKYDCKSPLKSKTWKPSWTQQRRSPAFVGDDGPPLVVFGRKKFLWGNMPSIDIVKLQQNEGQTFNKDMNLLFAASGDIRNAIKTVASLPATFSAKTSIVINDLDFDIVARNAIMLLLALTIPDPQQAAETIIHCWYSALIREVDFTHLKSLIPLIEDVCSKIKSRETCSIQAKKFTFGNCSVRLALEKESWTRLLSYLRVPHRLTSQKTHSIRLAVTKAPSRIDYRHRELLTQKPEHRICRERFREDGVLLPFSYSRDDFTVPNPTFFQIANWPMMDSADPISGWNFADILNTNSGPASNDLYGKLYTHIRSTICLFKDRLTKTGAAFELFNVNAAHLPSVFSQSPSTTPTSFARIDVSNICDNHYLGTGLTVSLLGPLLQKPAENHYATLLLLYMNAVKEASADKDATMDGSMAVLLKYKTVHDQYIADPANAAILMLSMLTLGQDVERCKYSNRIGFDKVAASSKMRIRKHNTIVEKWPSTLKLKPGQVGAEEEIAMLLASDYSYCERYVEWARKMTGQEETELAVRQLTELSLDVD